jgi:PEP-CTERM motif
MRPLIAVKRCLFVACCLLSIASNCEANQVRFTGTLTITGSPAPTIPGVSANDVATITVIADNGGTSLDGQSYFQSQVISAVFRAGSYVATFAFPFFVNDPLFTTGPTGIVVNAGFFDLDNGNSDNLGNSPRLFANAIDSGAFSAVFIQILDANVYTAAFVTPAAAGVPEPASVALLGLGVMAIAAARRKRKQ